MLATSIGFDAAIFDARKASAGICSLRPARADRLEEGPDADEPAAGKATRLNVFWLIGVDEDAPLRSDGIAAWKVVTMARRQDLSKLCRGAVAVGRGSSASMPTA